MTHSNDPRPTKLSRWRTVTSAALGLSALVAAGALLAVPEAEATSVTKQAPSKAARSVAVAEVADREHVRDLRFAGVVRAHRRAEVGFVLSGRVQARLVELGDRVEEGQELARLDRRQLARAVDNAEAVVARAQADLAHGQLEQRRVQSLSEVEAIAAADADDADHAISVASATRRQAVAQAKAARRDLAEGVLRAPFGGRISRIDIEPGESVAAGQAVLEILGDDVHELEVQLPESMLGDVHEGETVTVELPLLDRELRGTIRTIGSAAPQSAGLFPVVVALPADDAVRAGMTARLVVHSPIASGLAVPVEAVVDRSGTQPRVLTVHDGHVQVRPVQVLAIAGREAVLAAEIEAGQMVVTRGHAGLADGDAVLVPQ